MNEIRPFSTVQAVLVCAVFLLAGCRTYGGHGTVDANNLQLGAEVAEFSAALAQAESQYDQLRSAANLDQELVEEYRRTLEAHRAISARISGEIADNDRFQYRAASRKLGAIITQSRQLHNRYQNVLRAFVGDDAIVDPTRGSRYSAIPPSVLRGTDTALTAADVIRRASGG